MFQKVYIFMAEQLQNKTALRKLLLKLLSLACTQQFPEGFLYLSSAVSTW